MMRIATRSVVLAALAVGVCACSSGESDYQAAVAKAVSDTNARAFALCQVRSAVWGMYDATVEVDSTLTPDKKPRILKVKSGRVLTETPPSEVSTKVTKLGLVKIAAREDAFAKGVPFYIDAVKFAPPDSLSFVVASNPAVKIDRAAPRVQRVQRGEGNRYTSSIEIVVTNSPVASAPEPRTITLKENRLKDWVLSVITTDAGGRCLASNEVELASLAPK